MRRPCFLRRDACAVTKSPRAVVTTTTAPPPRCGCRLHRDGVGTNGPHPPPRHAPRQCTERAAAPWHCLHQCIVCAYGPDGRRMEVVAKLGRSRFSRPIPAKKSAHGIASVCGTFFEVRVFGGSATASMRRPCGLERLSEETRHHTRVVRIFPNAESCLPWERGLPGRIEKSRQGCRRSWQERAGKGT